MLITGNQSLKSHGGGGVARHKLLNFEERRVLRTKCFLLSKGEGIPPTLVICNFDAAEDYLCVVSNCKRGYFAFLFGRQPQGHQPPRRQECNCSFLNGARRWPHKLPVMGQDKSEGKRAHASFEISICGGPIFLSLCRYQSLLPSSAICVK